MIKRVVTGLNQGYTTPYEVDNEDWGHKVVAWYDRDEHRLYRLAQDTRGYYWRDEETQEIHELTDKDLEALLNKTIVKGNRWTYTFDTPKEYWAWIISNDDIVLTSEPRRCCS